MSLFDKPEPIPFSLIGTIPITTVGQNNSSSPMITVHEEPPTVAGSIVKAAQTALIGILSQRSSIIHDPQEVAEAAFNVAEAFVAEYRRRLKNPSYQGPL